MRLSSPIISLGRGDAAAVFRFVLIPRRKTEAIPLGIGSPKYLDTSTYVATLFCYTPTRVI